MIPKAFSFLYHLIGKCFADAAEAVVFFLMHIIIWICVSIHRRMYVYGYYTFAKHPFAKWSRHFTQSKMSKRHVTDSSIIADTHISVLHHLPASNSPCRGTIIHILFSRVIRLWRYHRHIDKHYRKISRTLVINTTVDHSDVVGASPVAAPATSSLST